MKPRLSLNIFSGMMSQVIGVAIGLIATPIIIRGLGESLYGLWSVSKAVVAWIAFINMMFSTATVRFVGQALGAGKQDEAREIQGAFQVWALWFGLLAACLLIGLSPFLAAHGMNIEAAYYSLAVRIFYVQAVFVFFEIFASVSRGVVGAYQRLDYFYAIRTISLACQSIGAAIWISNGQGIWVMVSWIAFMQMLEFMAFAISAQKFQGKRLKHFLSLKYIRKWGEQLYKYGSRLLSGYAAAQLMLPTSYLLISAFRPLEEVAYFTVLANLVRNVRTVATQIANAILPAASEKSGQSDEEGLRQLYLKGMKWSWLTMVPLGGMAIAFGSDFIGAWISPEFGVQVRPLVVPLVLGLCIFFLAGIPMVIAQGTGKAGAWAKASLVAGLLNVVFCVILIPKQGALGAANAMLGASSVLIVMQLFWVHTELKVPLLKLILALDIRVAIVTALSAWSVTTWIYLPKTLLGVLGSGMLCVLMMVILMPLWLPKPEQRWVLKRLGVGGGSL